MREVDRISLGEGDSAAAIAAVRAHSAAFATENGRPPRAFVLTFGCQQNVADSEKLSGMAKEMGYEIAESAEAAELILVNTCAIREHAEKRALSIVGQYKHLKEKNRDLIIGVCGCMVVQEHRREQLRKSYPYVDFILGTSVLHRLPELLAKKLSQKRRIFGGDEEYAIAENVPILRDSPYRAWVSIMYGCNNFCSYCIVPYVRGRERSRAPEDVIAEVRDLVARGYKDITLLGQNVNSYGKGESHGVDFAELLARLDAIEGDFVLRFMTSHPKDATRRLVDVMAAGKHIAHHFHLPLQSGSDTILKRMNRHYDRAAYLSILDYMREKMPDIAVTSDIIVGFPGETDADFEDTLSMLSRVRFDMIYSFIYSPRKGTPAAAMEDQIPKEVSGKRFDRLLALQEQIALDANEPLMGTEQRVLCDGLSKDDGMLSGRNGQNKIVFWEDDGTPAGEWATIKIDRVAPFALYGKKNQVKVRKSNGNF
ncbi:MAG: tRNA (N6-isopentenyl adenosine(37)-C2)-methylthiotransferase MiaB [Clostridia bacterium]|nr:tRNA (N6-isopentenyl adenosine(37)-C2)-methylthiotransferase MiaB [Clostridia bacterium]